MNFYLLGPVLARFDDRPVTLRRRRERLLLALLLLEPGRPRSTDQLVDLLWEDEPPADARATVAVHVSRLRRGLLDAQGGPHQRVDILRRPAGYMITANPDTIDAHQFTGRLQAAGSIHDKADRVRLLNEALALWRGEPLADAASPQLRDRVCAHLIEQRWQTLEMRIELEIDLGRHDTLIPELADLAARFPLRERLVAARMLTLYRADRQIDALAVYTDAAARFATEYGVDPGERLRDMHTAILRNDLSLSWPQPAAVGGDTDGRPSERPVNQLPATTPYFTGRAEIVHESKRLLRDAGSIVLTFTGMGGLGKTTVAIRAARAVADAFTDGCLYVDLRGTDPAPPPPLIVLGTLLRSMGVPSGAVPVDPDERVGLYRSMTASRRILIVLDNAADAAQVRPLLPAGDGCAAIVTSRDDLVALDAARFALAPLEATDSRMLLAAIASENQLADAPDAASDLVRMCGGVPLALRVVAARLVGRNRTSPQALATQLADTNSRLDEMRIGDLDVGASLMLSYRRLDPDAATLLRRIGSLDLPGYTDWHCRVLLDDEPSTALDGLMRTHLLDEISPGRYRPHDLVRFAARTADIDDAPRRTAAFSRIATECRHAVLRALEQAAFGRNQYYLDMDDTAAYPVQFADLAAARSWLDAECDNLLALIRDLAREGRDDHAWRLAASLVRYLHAAYRLDEWFAIEPLLDQVADRIDLIAVRAMVAHCKGLARQNQARWPEALAQYEAALELAERSGDERLAAHMATYVARILLQMTSQPGAVERAGRMLDHALNVPSYIDIDNNRAYLRNELVVLAFVQDRFTEAARECSLTIADGVRLQDLELRRLGHHSMANICLTHANTYLEPVSVRRAELRQQSEYHAREAIALAREMDIPAREARSWEQLGYVLMYEDRRSEATEAFDRALTILDRLQDRRANTLRDLISEHDWTI